MKIDLAQAPTNEGLANYFTLYRLWKSVSDAFHTAKDIPTVEFSHWVFEVQSHLAGDELAFFSTPIDPVPASRDVLQAKTALRLHKILLNRHVYRYRLPEAA